MAKNKIEYTELAKAKVSDSRNVIVSSCSKGGFTIAQQLEAKENDKTTSVFMKGAFHVEDTQGLYNLRDSLNLAIAKAESENEDSNTWDE